MAGYIIWSVTSLIFFVLGIVCFCSKEPVHFWANSNEKIEVTDVKAYNRAMGIMWFVFGVIIDLLGLPLLIEGEEGVPVILFVTCFGTVGGVIVMILIYMFGIEKKYRIR